MLKKVKKTKQRNKLGMFIFFIILLLVGFLIYRNSQSETGRIASNEARDSLQIGFYNPFSPQKTQPITSPPPTKNIPTKKPDTTKTPLPPEENVSQYCPHNTHLPITDPACKCSGWHVTCVDNKCVKFDPSRSNIPSEESCDVWNERGWCAPPFTTEGVDGDYCIGKPIIYLYPEKPTLVDVKIETVGNIFISIPTYPEGGWRNVLAYPNGNLSYQTEQYRELFYETDVEDFQKPVNGINIPREKVEEELKRVLTLLGLNEFERKEFMDFWVPILENQSKAHIQFSLIQGKAKDEIDKVIINPKPDTFIEILVYFKPLDKPFQGKLLELPENPPARQGFTAVEWGGVIDNKEKN